MPDLIYSVMGSVLAFFYGVVPNYGVAIVGLTVVVRLILFPLTAKQARSMHRMQQVQPEIKRLQERHKGDRQKLNEEIMKFYKENKVNPLAGCLPLLAQMPVFFALFGVLKNPDKHLPQGSSLLADYSVAKEAGNGLHAFGMDMSQTISADHGGFVDAVPYFLLVGLVVLTGYLQFRQTQSRQTGPSNPQMNMVGKVFPFMFAFLSLSLPAGVVVYFFINNLWQIGQQALIYGAILPNASAPVIVGGANGSEPDDSPKIDGPKADGPKGGPKSDGVKAKKAEGKELEAGPKDVAGERPATRDDPARPRGGPDAFGRAQPTGSRPKPKRRRR